MTEQPTAQHRFDDPRVRTSQRVIAYLEARRMQTLVPPSLREIADAVGVSSASTAYHHVNNLRRAGVVVVSDPKDRAAHIALASPHPLMVALQQEVAGNPAAEGLCRDLAALMANPGPQD